MQNQNSNTLFSSSNILFYILYKSIAALAVLSYTVLILYRVIGATVLMGPRRPAAVGYAGRISTQAGEIRACFR
jgi:hypothetical protein